MTARLGEMLERVLAGEPALGDEEAEVFRRADALRRRRTRLLLIAGAVIAASIVLAGYLLTNTLLPTRSVPRSTPATRGAATFLAPPPFRARPSSVAAGLRDGRLLVTVGCS